MKILIVEDNTISLRAVEMILKSNDFETISAKSGVQALDRLGEHSDIGLVLTDLMMPEMDGFQLMEEMGRNPSWKEIPVVVMTSLSDADTVRRVVSLGCSSYLVKPLREEALVPKMRQFLRDTGPRDELTGLFRPSYFLDRVREEIVDSTRRKEAAGLVAVELERTEPSDRPDGHGVADEVLVRAADKIRQNLRAADKACRKGGNEFVVLVPGLAGEQAGKMAQRLIDGIQASSVELADGRRVDVGVSVGIALFPTGAGSWQELWSRAEEAIHQAKTGGIGRWAVWSEQAG